MISDGLEIDETQDSWTNVGDLERWFSVVAGSALTTFALTRKSWALRSLSLLGGTLLYRGTTGHCPVYGTLGMSTAEEPVSTLDRLVGTKGVEVKASITINRPVNEVYGRWRNFEKFPSFMKHLSGVEILPNGRSRWFAKAPIGGAVSWTAEVLQEAEDRLIAWRSVPESSIVNAGIVRFEQAPGGRGTEVHVHFAYRAPLGKVGVLLARILGEEPLLQVREDLRRLKQLMETGEIATMEGQTSGRDAVPPGEERPDLDKRYGMHERDMVEEASWESFPASDPPAKW